MSRRHRVLPRMSRLPPSLVTWHSWHWYWWHRSNVGINSKLPVLLSQKSHFPTSWTLNYQQHPRLRAVVAWFLFNYEKLSKLLLGLFVQTSDKYKKTVAGGRAFLGHRLLLWVLSGVSLRHCRLTKEPNHIHYFHSQRFLIDTTEADAALGRSYLTLLSQNIPKFFDTQNFTAIRKDKDIRRG